MFLLPKERKVLVETLGAILDNLDIVFMLLGGLDQRIQELERKNGS